MGVLG